MFVRFPMEVVPVAHRGSICCFQDFLKEKNEANVSEGQFWERVKWGRLLHTGKYTPYWEGPCSHSEHSVPPRTISPKSLLRFLSRCLSCGEPRDSGYPWISPCCRCLWLSTALSPTAKQKVITPGESALITDDVLDYSLPSSKSSC